MTSTPLTTRARQTFDDLFDRPADLRFLGKHMGEEAARDLMKQFSSTAGLTMPEPRISSQSSPPMRNSPFSHEQPISTSADGSVNGK